jgi:YD repeat-containing protein
MPGGEGKRIVVADHARLAYDNANRRTSVTLPNGVVVAYTYDAASRVTGITYTQGGTTIGTLTYGYDANGRRTSMGGTMATGSTLFAGSRIGVSCPIGSIGGGTAGPSPVS